jgi:uncharacterized protein involved in outer membrane biogenesis
LLVAIPFNLLLLVGLALYLMDDDDYRDVLIWSADYFLDSRLEIDGSFSIKFAQEVELNAEKVHLKANDGSYQLALGNFYLQQRFTSYLRTGTFWINKISADDLQVEITATQSNEEFDWQQLSVVPVVIEETRVRNLSLIYTNSDQKRHTIDLQDIVLDDENNQGPIKVSATGTVDSRPVVFAGTLGSLAQLRSDHQNFPVAFTLRSPGLDAESAGKQDKPVIELEGTVDRTRPGDSAVDATFNVDLSALAPFVSQKIIAHGLGHLRGSAQMVNVHYDWGIKNIRFSATDTDLYRLKIDAALDKSKKLILHSEFEVPDPAAFGAKFGIDLGGYAAYSGKGQLSGDLKRLHYEGKVSIGRIESDLGVTVSLHGSRPSLQGKWDVRELYLADIGINRSLGEIVDPTIKPEMDGSADSQGAKAKPAGAAAAGTAGSASGSEREPIDLSALRKLDLDLEVSIDRIVGADYALSQLAGKIRLSDGLLSIAPIRMTYPGGTADMELTLAARKTPEVSFKIEAQNLVLDELLDRLRPELRIKGKLDLQADLKSAGGSVDELISAVAGDVSLSTEKVTLPRQYLQYFSIVDPPSEAAGDSYTAVEIDGAASVKIGKALQLTAQSVRLKTDDDSYRLTLEKLNLRQSLVAYRETDTLLIHELLLEDAQLEIAVAETAGQTAPEPGSAREDQWNEVEWLSYDLPSLVIEKMQLGRLSLDYRKGVKQHKANLVNFSIENEDSKKPMTLSAAGTIDAVALQLEGTVGTPAQPRGENRRYPVDFSLSRDTADAAAGKRIISVSGALDNKAAGGGQLDAKFNVVISELMEIFDQGTDANALGQWQGEVNIAEVNDRWGIKKLHLAAIDTELYDFHLDGEIDSSFTLELNSEIKIPDPAALGAQFGIDLSGYKPYNGKGVLSGTRSKLDYRGLVHIGRIQSETSLTITRVSDKPFIQGKFTIPDLYLPDIGLNFRMGGDPDTPEKASPEKAVPEKDDTDTSAQLKVEKPAPAVTHIQPIFSHEPLDLDGLRYFNLDLEVLIDQITGSDFSIDQLTGEIGLTDGVLRVTPMRLVLEGGDTNLDLVLDARERPSATLKVSAEDLVLGGLISQLQTEVPVEGKARLDIDVKTSGDSAHDMASALSGDVGFGLENARLPKKYLDFLSADLFGWMFRMITFEDSYTNVDCLLMDFDVDQGVAKSNLLVADGPTLKIEGEATVNLGLETIDMVLLPKQKQGFYTHISSVKIDGPLRDPSVHTSAGKAAFVGVGGLALIPEVVVPLGLIDMLWKKLFSSKKDSKGCAKLVAKYREKQEKAAAQKAE